jgi:hypothetical protein
MSDRLLKIHLTYSKELYDQLPAESFMPVDGLADVGEHTAEKIIELISTQKEALL